MSMKLGMVMDPIGSINTKKDSSFAMLLKAQEADFELYYFEQKDLYLKNGIAYGDAKIISVKDDPTDHYQIQSEITLPLAELQVILMRKDPPFDEEFLYTTYLLEQAEHQGVLVVNRPQSLRDANEKLFAANFPACCPPTLVTQSIAHLRAFLNEYQDIVCKPLNSMGGTSIFRLKADDVNANVIFDLMTAKGHTSIMAQQYIPAIKEGDKRIILIDGVAIPYALARVPQGDDWRGNLVAGAKGVVQSLTDRDKWICDQLTPTLKARGLYFVGIDVIGDYLTEINVTSPTGIRELDAGAGLDIAGQLVTFIKTLI